MLWIIFALGSHLVWAFANVGDKYVISNKIKNPYIFMIFTMILGIVPASIIAPFVGFKIPNVHEFLWLIAAGALYFFGGFPYIKSIQKEDVTRINVWWNFIPIFSLFIAWFTIGEKFNTNQLIAFGILVLGGVIASIHFKKNSIKFSKVILLMLLASFCFASYAVIIKYTIKGLDEINVFIWTSIIMGLFGLKLFGFKKVRKAAKEELQNIDSKLGGMIFGLMAIDKIGIFLNMSALALGPVALVYSMEGAQVIFVFMIAIAISLFTKINIHEELDRTNVLLKILSIILMISGILILNGTLSLSF